MVRTVRVGLSKGATLLHVVGRDNANVHRWRHRLRMCAILRDQRGLVVTPRETAVPPTAAPTSAPPPPSPAGIARIDACVWAQGWRTVAVIGASKNAGKTTALNALLAAVVARGERAGVCSIGVDGEASDVWLATAKPSVHLEKDALVVTARAALTDRHREVHPLGFSTGLGDTVLAQVRAPGPVLLAGLAHRGHVEQAMAALQAAGAQRVLVDGAYHRQAVADAPGVQALVLAVGAILPLDQATATLLALTVPADVGEGTRVDVPGGLTDARLATLDLTGVHALRVAGPGAVLLSVRGHERLAARHVRLVARRSVPLACVTANPHVPLGEDHAAQAYADEVQRWLAAHGVTVPVVDVVRLP